MVALLLFKPAVKVKAENGGGEIITRVIAHSNDGIFHDHASYTFDVKNNFDTQQSGSVSYVVTTFYGVTVAKDSVHITIPKNSSSFFNFDIPVLNAGFYKISFMINTTDYDDTTRRVFGIRPQELISSRPRPADFDSFWQTAKKQLAEVTPDYQMIEQPQLEKINRKVYRVQMQSLGNVTINALLTMPQRTSKSSKPPVRLELSGYHFGPPPLSPADADVAVLSFNVSGMGNMGEMNHPTPGNFITLNIADKDRYILRAAIMDCIRMMDFIYSRNDLDHDRIQVSGGSLGGYLAVAMAGLDNRMALISAQNPVLSDIRSQEGEVQWPLNNMINYAKTKPGVSFAQIMSNMDYYDLKNFAGGIRKPVLIGVGLLDQLAPPDTEYVLYNNIPSKYRDIMIFKDLGHEVPKAYFDKDDYRMHDVFAME